ncbi:unnamed protein product [Lymnaea stagnalis]|uniref:Uncharacterized protein n=1 Tax=Lymnaea stagnalis TaxID=6523 RepID=A0AAV2H1R3_LYMST
METTCLIADTAADEDVDSIPMVTFHVPDTHQLFGNEYSRLPSSDKAPTEMLPSPEDALFPIDEGAWSGFSTSPHREYSIQTLENCVINHGYEEEGHLYFPIDENAWGQDHSAGAASPDSEALVLEETDGRVTFHNSGSTLSKGFRSHWWKRPKTLKLHRGSCPPPEARSPVSSSPGCTNGIVSLSSSSNINRGFQDFDDHGTFNHRVDRFELDTAMLFRSLSQPKQSKKSFWSSLLCMWCRNCSAPCRCVCCSCRCSGNDEKGVGFFKMAKQKLLGQLHTVQIIISLIIVVLSAMVFFPLGFNFRNFNDQCLLYSDIYLTWINETAGSINLELTSFGDQDYCNYTTFINVVVAIASVIFIWFFIHAKSEENTEHSEVKLQLPVLLVNFGMFICILVSSSRISTGFNTWCSNIVRNNPLKLGKLLTCKEFEKIIWVSTDKLDKSSVYTNSTVAEISSWFLALTLLLQCLLTSVQLYHDFVASYQVAEVPHKKMDEVDDTDSICLELGHTNRGSDEYILSEDHFTPDVAEYNMELNRRMLAEVIVHQNILAIATGDQLPAKTDKQRPIVLDTETFKKKSKSKKLSPADSVTLCDQGLPPAEAKKPRKLIELKTLRQHVTLDVPDSSINSDNSPSDSESQHLKSVQDIMNSRSCEDGKW